jgi:DNA-binding IclR family transcriptional regulator
MSALNDSLRAESSQKSAAIRAPTRDDRSGPGRRDRNFIEPLARGLSILQAFTPRDTWLGNMEVSERVHLPTATVNRLLKTLQRLGYLKFSAQRRQYKLAPSVLGLGYAAVANSNVRQVLREHMQKLADSHHMFVTLGQRDRLDIVLLEICHSNSSLLTLRLEPGARLPIAETAMGWALIGALPDEEKEYLLAHIERRQRSRWPAVERDITRALAQMKRAGYCASPGAWRSEISTIAIPLVPADQSSALVLGCSSASPYLPTSRIAQIGPQLVALVQQIAQELPSSEL